MPAGPRDCDGVTRPPRVLPKSSLGVSGGTLGLLDKDRDGRPTQRFCQEWPHHGVPLAQGTLPEGLQRLAVLFEPVMRALYARQRGAKRFPGDATRWAGFEEVEGNTGHRWSLWVTPSASGVFDRMAPGRGADVPHAHVAKRRKALVDVGLVWDRDSASQGLAKDHDERILASCWAHVRRDCLKAARRGPEIERWMLAWVDDMRALDRLHAARLEVGEETVRLAQQPAAWVERHRDLEPPLRQRQARCAAPLQEPALPLGTHKVLSSLPPPWDGLTVFGGRPAVALAKKSAERRLRHPVVGRKHYDGSGSVWSAHLAARMLRLGQTVLRWGLKPHHWLGAFFHAWAEQGGKSPPALSAFLPWQRGPERRAELARPVPATWPPVAGLCQEREETAAANPSSGPMHLVPRSKRRPMAHA